MRNPVSWSFEQKGRRGSRSRKMACAGCIGAYAPGRTNYLCHVLFCISPMSFSLAGGFSMVRVKGSGLFLAEIPYSYTGYRGLWLNDHGVAFPYRLGGVHVDRASSANAPYKNQFCSYRTVCCGNINEVALLALSPRMRPCRKSPTPAENATTARAIPPYHRRKRDAGARHARCALISWGH